MATTKRRVNVSLPEYVDVLLKKVALRDDVPEATKALELIQIGLEIEEDAMLNAVADQRNKRGAKFISHDKAWK